MQIKTAVAMMAAGSMATMAAQRYAKGNNDVNRTLKKIIAQNEKAMRAIKEVF